MNLNPLTKGEAFALFQQWGLKRTGVLAIDSRQYREGCKRLLRDEQRIMTRQEYEQACSWLAEFLEV